MMPQGQERVLEHICSVVTTNTGDVRAAAVSVRAAEPTQQQEMEGAAAGTGMLGAACFEVDVTPPVGSPLCNGSVRPVASVDTPLTARGIILLGSGAPIVMVIFDWVGISNESHDAFRNALTEAVGTHLERVAVHTLHPHDAPGSDFAAERLLEQHGLGGRYSDPEFNRDVLRRLSAAAAAAVGRARPVAHYGAGSAPVHQVASTRRVQGPDGNVQHVRYSAERDARWRAHPEGTIDPLLKCVTLWDAGGQCICALSYYAVHPMSYYGQGLVGWDFVGIARHSRETALPGVPHLHFQGASGNITAGKYNDGSVSQRGVLAARIEASMKAAWESSRQHLRALPASDVGWHVEQVALPVRDTISGKEAELLAIVADESLLQRRRIFAARDLAFVRRQARGHQTTLARLALGAHTSVLFMPGELFVCVTVTRLHLHVWCMYVCMLCVCV
jgi:hypothetical protein